MASQGTTSYTFDKHALKSHGYCASPYGVPDGLKAGDSDVGSTVGANCIFVELISISDG